MFNLIKYVHPRLACQQNSLVNKTLCQSFEPVPLDAPQLSRRRPHSTPGSKNHAESTTVRGMWHLPTPHLSHFLQRAVQLRSKEDLRKIERDQKTVKPMKI